MTALAALALGLAVLLGTGGAVRPRLPASSEPPPPTARGWTPGRRLLVAGLAGSAVPVVVPGVLGLVAVLPAAGAAWLLLARVEPPELRRRREATRRDLPAVVGLLATALHAGASTDRALALVAQALPGPAAAPLRRTSARLALGADPGRAWADLARAEPALAPLGRTMEGAHRSGAPVAVAVERLADELAALARAEVEDRARAVGVKAAVPLGLCLLPAFVLIGIVPLVAGLMGSVL